MATIQDDILVTEILLRLHARTLASFKCANKFFLSYISSPEFIKLQLSRELLSGNPERLLITLGIDVKTRTLYCWDLDTPESPPFQLALPQPFHDPRNRINNVGSCNGLVCLESSYNEQQYFIILNPSTGTRTIRHGIDYPSLLLKQMRFGFGHDSISDDYKVVGVIEDFHMLSFRQLVYVYSMNAYSWRFVKQKLSRNRPPVIKHKDGALIDNYLLHWLLISPDNIIISCFDLRTENWGVDVPSPPCRNQAQLARNATDLGVLNGCLCLLTRVSEERSEVWIMKEYGVQESWMKLLINCGYILRPPLAYETGTKNENLLISHNQNDGYGLSWYNIEHQTIQNFKFNIERNTPMALRELTLSIASIVPIVGDCQIND